MFTLVSEKNKYYKVKQGQSAIQIQKILKIPITEEVYCGKIICVDSKSFFEYAVKVGETYASIANKFKVDKDELKSINGKKPVYPTRIILVPEYKGDCTDE